jgi:hypothetical protein
MCYDFHYGISNEEEDLTFATKLDFFSIGTTSIPTYNESISKLAYIKGF